jgi:hypothetical protein
MAVTNKNDPRQSRLLIANMGITAGPSSHGGTLPGDPDASFRPPTLDRIAGHTRRFHLGVRILGVSRISDIVRDQLRLVEIDHQDDVASLCATRHDHRFSVSGPVEAESIAITHRMSAAQAGSGLRYSFALAKG